MYPVFSHFSYAQLNVTQFFRGSKIILLHYLREKENTLGKINSHHWHEELWRSLWTKHSSELQDFYSVQVCDFGQVVHSCEPKLSQLQRESSGLAITWDLSYELGLGRDIRAAQTPWGTETKKGSWSVAYLSSLLHFNQISLKCIWLISSLSCWYGCPSVLELFLIGLFKPSLNWLCSFQGKPTQYHSNASLPQPLMLKKVKLKSSMKTYKTFYN